MASPRIVIVDYGLGNLFSVVKALEAVGAEPVVSESPEAVEKAERLILPGVGAFGDGMKGLMSRDLVLPIRDYGSRGGAMLGICLGMQLLMTTSEEFGLHRGLDLIPGGVVALRGDPRFRGKTPNVGWSGLQSGQPWDGSVLSGLPSGAEMYFVHSFAVVPQDPALRLAEIRYGGVDVCAVVRKGAITGCQFHPEKSRRLGLKILQNFVFGPSPEGS